MEIVILDGYMLNPGDLSWKELERLGQITVYDRTPNDAIVQRAQQADIVLTNKTPLRSETIAMLPKLKYIGVLATGYDVIDISAATNHGITVTNIPGYGTASVAQMVFALLLELCQHSGLHSEAVRGGEWTTNTDWCFWKKPLIELQDKTIGIVGFGRIGQQTAHIARAFGMRVASVRSGNRAPDNRGLENIEPGESAAVHWCNWEELLSVSDVLSLHCPLTSQTEQMINQKSLRQMKQTSLLINTSRGKLIAEQELADALNQGVIAGAGLDVLSIEPPTADHPLLTAKNCILTPHIAWASKEARARLLESVVGNLEAFLSGKVKNVIG